MKRILLIPAFLAGLLFLLLEMGWLSCSKPWAQASGWLRIPEAQRPSLGISEDLFTDAPGKARIHWLGHSGFLIEWAGQRILLDPNQDGRCSVSKRFLEPSKSLAGQSVDLICVSHAHYDHLSIQTLQSLSHIGQIILPAKSEIFLPAALPGDPERKGLGLWESTPYGSLTITAVPARHNGHRHHPWKSRFRAVGYVISDGTSSLYFAGDTARQEDAEAAIRERLAPDTAIVPIGAFAPRIPLKIHHLSPEEAVESGLALNASRVFPCHFGTFRLSLDRPSTALPRFAAAAHDAKLPWALAPFAKDPFNHRLPSLVERGSGLAEGTEARRRKSERSRKRIVRKITRRS